jgi:catechol 2,3-dioxygenase-like lactoylglutathione lyase family enzyme
MKSSLSHLQIHIEFTNLGFYKDLLEFLGWKELFSSEEVAGFSDGTESGASLWFTPVPRTGETDYDMNGVNHIGLSVSEQSDVDKTVEFLKEKGVEAKFETPRHRPEFAFEEGKTYYQVMFESPDKLLFEVVYTGPKM